MADLFGMALGSLLVIACFREIAFAKDNSRLSWMRGGLIGTPFVLVVSSIGRAENGSLNFSESVVQASIAAGLTLMLFVWAKARADQPYERKHRKIPRVLAWCWIVFMSAIAVLKLSTGLA